MKDKKHIDRVFQEKLKDLEVVPDASIWDSINKELHQKKKDRKAIPIWWKIGGVAAILLLAFTIGKIMLDSSSENSKAPIIVDTQNKEGKLPSNKINTTEKENTTSPKKILQNTLSNKADSEYQNEDNTQNKNNSVVNPSKQNVVLSNNEASSKTLAKTQNETTLAHQKELNTQLKNQVNDESKSDYSLKNNNYQLADNYLNQEKDNNSNNKITGSSEEETLITNQKNDEKEELTTEALALNDQIDEKEKKPINRWHINPVIAPVYFNSLGQGSSIDNQFNNNPKSGNINFSYGIGASYAITKRLSIKTGVNRLKVSYDTENVLAFESANPNIGTPFRNVKLDNNTNVMFLSANNISFGQVPDEFTSTLESQLKQELGFIEIPMELKYNIINKKFGLNLISGFSVLFLDDNNVYSVVNDVETYIGQATNINNTSYSANFGLGLDFEVTEHVNFNIDPMFKYQINTFKDTSGDFRPFVAGIYSGINIKF